MARVAPLLVLAILTAFQGQLGEASRYWIYLAKTLAGIWLIFQVKPFVPEMKWRLSLPAVAAGILVFVLWVGLDGRYPLLSDLWRSIVGGTAPPSPHLWNPGSHYGYQSTTAWFFIIVRILGSTLVVPPIEEVFYRSFLYRYIANPDFEKIPLGQFRAGPFFWAAIIFGLAHREWLPGILCAFVYQGLVCWKGRLGDAIAAHAITNFLLGLWVAWKGAWNFW